ncbi:hypothetical protein BJV77DRAFT_1109246 [Russula vinacea]|nr:hypothetical protein BJV77DRAFT_1109246 [Russula vinacea]
MNISDHERPASLRPLFGTKTGIKDKNQATGWCSEPKRGTSQHATRDASFLYTSELSLRVGRFKETSFIFQIAHPPHPRHPLDRGWGSLARRSRARFGSARPPVASSPKSRLGRVPSSLIEKRQFSVQANLQYLFLNSTDAAMVGITVLNLRRKLENQIILDYPARLQKKGPTFFQVAKSSD